MTNIYLKLKFHFYAKNIKNLLTVGVSSMDDLTLSHIISVLSTEAQLRGASIKLFIPSDISAEF